MRTSVSIKGFARPFRAVLAGTSLLALLLSVGMSQAIVFAASTNLYVDASSSSCNDAGLGTPSQPYCSIGKAAQLAQPGDTVAVTGGTYTGTSVNTTYTGTSASPITFTASPGVTISGGIDAFAISNRSYIVINGFTINATSGFGIAVASSNHITISNNWVTGVGQRLKNLTAAGISLSGTTASLVTHNTSDNNSDHGIFIWGASSNNTISFNEASFNAEGWQRNANGINVIDTGSTGNTVLGNVVHDNEDSGLQFFSGANNGLGAQNVSYNNGDHGIDDYNVTGGVLIGNTIYHNCTDGINVEGTSGNYTVVNNISVDNAVYPAYNGIKCGRRTGNIGIYDSAPASTIVDYNLVNLTTSGSLYVWNNTSYSSPAAFYQGAGQEHHGIQADPRWISPANANFRLQPGSAAIDAANSGVPGESTVDADGNPRLDDPSTPNSGVGPRLFDDRGAYEFQTIDTQAPSVPSGLAGNAPSQNQVSLTWNPSTDNVGVAGYTVYRNGAQLAVVTSPGYSDSSASASTTYSYTVDAVDWANNHSMQTSAVSVTTPAPDTQAPAAPTGLAAPGASANSVSLTWNASIDNVGVAGYTVYRNGIAAGNSATTSFTDTGLNSSTSYTYTVDAFDGAGNHSAQSTAVSATTGFQPIAYVQSAAYSKGGRVTTTTITLSRKVGAGDLLTGLFSEWDAAGQVQVSDNVNGPWTRARGITFSSGKGDVALYYLANTLASASGLTITVSASAPTYLSGAVGEYSGVAISSPLDQVAIRSGSGTSVDSGSTPAVAASELAFGAMTANSNPGTITAGSSAGLSFQMRSIYTSIANADIVATNAGTQNARFTVANSVTWYAVVAVFKPVVTSNDGIPPSTPSGLTATGLTGSVTLNWGASTDNVGVTGYTVYRGGAVIATVGGSVLSYSDTTVAASTTYGYAVNALDAAGNHSPLSAVVNVTTSDWTAPSIPGSLSATATSPTQVNLAWAASTDNVGVAGYTIYRNGSQLATVGATNLAYADTSAAPASTYSYTVDAFDAAANHSAKSQPASATTPSPPDTTAPTTPAGLAAAAPGPTQVNLTWNASTDDVGVSGYTVYRNGSTLATVSAATLTYTDGTVAPATGYSYSVDAYDGAGNHSAMSSPISVTTPAPAGDTTPPAAPAGLSASAPGPTQVNLAWNASTDNVGVSGYTLYRDGSTLATVSAATLTYSDNTVAPGTSYTYSVDAFDAAGNHSAPSASAAVTTATVDSTPPSIPAGVSAAAPSSSKVNLAWNASSDNVGVSGYTLYRDGSTLATVSAATLTYSDNTVAPGTSYSYSVDAFDAAGNHSAPSAPAAVTTATVDSTPPSIPTGVSATAPSSAKVNLAWNASSDNVGVTGYTVYRNGSSLGTVSGATLTYTDNAVTPSTSYSYTVDAFDAKGNHSSQSAPATVQVPAQPQQPKFVQAKVVTTGSRVTSTTVTLGAVSQGDLLVGEFGQFDSAGHVSVSDNVNGAWTRAAASTTWSGSNGDIALYYFPNSAAAPSGLTITISATTATYLQGAPVEYSGVATVNPLDQVVVAKGTGTSADSGLAPATGAGELVYGAMTATSGAGTLVPGTSQGVTFVKRAQSTSGSEGVEDIVTAAAGQQHAGFTFPNSVPWFMVCAVFKPA
jgi:parallel beta-helix repeat protein